MFPIYSTSSGIRAGSAQITSISGAVCGVDLKAPTTGQVTLTLYDSNTSDVTGKEVLAEIHMDAGLAGVNHEFAAPIIVNHGIYALLTGTSTYLIRYLVG